jgi:hypothetical protein
MTPTVRLPLDQVIHLDAMATVDGVQSTSAPPGVQAWSCTACQTSWTITTVNPRPYFDRLAATVEQLGATRSVLRQVISLADDAATLSDELRTGYRRLPPRPGWRSAP